MQTCLSASWKTKGCKSQSVEIHIPAQTVERILLEWREASWITQCSTRFVSSAILWQTLAGRCVRITWQYAGRRQTYPIFCRDQKQPDRFSCMKAQVFSFSSVLWNVHSSEVQLPQSVCCPEQNTGRAIRGNPQQPHRRETASRMKLQFYQRPSQKCPPSSSRRRFDK